MKHADNLIVFAAALALSVMPAMAQQQGGAPQQQQPGVQQQQPQQQQASGELVRVDTKAQTLSIKTAAGSDVLFMYSDATKVTGGEQNVAGLATKSGAKVTVTFTMKGQDRLATQIDIEKAGN